VIEPFDHERSAETTYWLRLAFQPHVAHRVEKPIHFLNQFRIQPCEILSPSAVLADLEEKLTALQLDNQWSAHGKQGLETIVTNIFRKENTSTRIEEHRISIVTDEKFWVCNPHVEGSCGFLDVQSVPGQQPIARTWFAGANSYPASDPLTMTRSVYEYLRDWAPEPAHAKSMEQISAAVSPNNHNNVSHIVEVLCASKRADRTGEGTFFFLSPVVPFLLRSGAEMHDASMADEGIALRNLLYGRMTVRNSQTTVISEFKFKGFRVTFDLAFK
jgi:hypothetical protein